MSDIKNKKIKNKTKKALTNEGDGDIIMTTKERK